MARIVIITMDGITAIAAGIVRIPLGGIATMAGTVIAMAIGLAVRRS